MPRAFLSRTALGSLLGAVLLAILCWWFSPLLSEVFDDPLWRGALAAVPVLGWAVVTGLFAWLRRRRDARLIVETAAAANASATLHDTRLAEAEASQRQALADALGKLRRAAGGKGQHLYQLPWYLLIGPPGTGKTTALLHSGLNFPLAEGKVGGVGGTRQCDWWLSDSAVLIDTAGRYTTQDSDTAADRAEWEGFLDLLRRARPRLPLNGVLVTIGTDLLGRLDDAGREAHARAIRRRLHEVEARLGLTLPVYLLVTKADLVLGFTEYFGNLDREARRQVWGVTFRPEEGRRMEGAASAFAPAFAALCDRLTGRLPDRLQAERGTAQRVLIAGFPGQFAALEQPLSGFLRAAFGGSRLEPAPFLRGVYFTSGTQEGTPLDRLAGALARGFGLDPSVPAAAMASRARAFFIERLLQDVIFGEARLAALRGRASRRGAWIQAGAWAAAALLVLAGAGYAWQGRGTEEARMARLGTALERAEDEARAAPPTDRVADADLSRVLGYLEASRALPEAAHGPGPGFGLSQETVLAAGSEAAYRRALGLILLPRLLNRLEAQMRAGLHSADLLYEATRIYLMLGRQGPLDPALVREWMRQDWLILYPGAVNQQGREALHRHLDALLGEDLPAFPLDGALVDEARRVFSRLPMAARVYGRLRPLTQTVPPWRPADVLGQAGQRHFRRASGQPLTEGVPGVFTVEGLYGAVLPRLPQAVLEAAGEAWVLGPGATQAGDPRRLEAEVLGLYAAEYARAWQAVLDDLVLPPPVGLGQAAEALNLLGAPNSPLKDLVRAVARQLSPGTPPEGMAAASQAGPAGERVAAALGAAGQQVTEPVARLIEERFRPLREAAGAPMDEILLIINDLYAQVARLAAAPQGAVLAPSAGLDPGQRLMAAAARQPRPLRNWLEGLARASQQARAGGAKTALAAAAAQNLAPLCRSLETQFPFRRSPGAPSMPLQDFVRLFAPTGALDQFFNQHVRPFADISGPVWHPAVAEGMDPPVSGADLRQFQRAHAIREAFFPAGVAGYALRWQLLPTGLSGAEMAVLETDGASFAWPPPPPRPIEMSWPASAPAALRFEPSGPAAAPSEEGPWAALRLVMLGRLSATAAPDRFRLSLGSGGQSAEFQLLTGSRINPFGLRDLGEFRCPVLAAP
jgi:type VI secretion system protein ImpL